MEVLKSVEEIGFTFFESSDVVRHPVVAAIVNAYDEYEKTHEKDNQHYYGRNNKNDSSSTENSEKEVSNASNN